MHVSRELWVVMLHPRATEWRQMIFTRLWLIISPLSLVGILPLWALQTRVHWRPDKGLQG